MCFLRRFAAVSIQQSGSYCGIKVIKKREQRQQQQQQKTPLASQATGQGCTRRGDIYHRNTFASRATKPLRGFLRE